MLITGGCHAVRTGAIFTSLTVGLRGTDRRFIFDFLNDMEGKSQDESRFAIRCNAEHSKENHHALIKVELNVNFQIFEVIVVTF